MGRFPVGSSAYVALASAAPRGQASCVAEGATTSGAGICSGSEALRPAGLSGSEGAARRFPSTCAMATPGRWLSVATHAGRALLPAVSERAVPRVVAMATAAVRSLSQEGENGGDGARQVAFRRAP
jgi:hypothetical protein